MPGWCGLDGDLLSLLDVSPAAECGRQLWPPSPLSRPRTYPTIGPSHPSLPASLFHSWSPRSLTSTSSSQRWHKICLNEVYVITLDSEEVDIPASSEINHLLESVFLYGSHICRRWHGNYRLGQADGLVQADGLANNVFMGRWKTRLRLKSKEKEGLEEEEGDFQTWGYEEMRF